MAQDLASSYAHCESLLRDEDRDAWLASLFGPASARPHLHALGAFFTEIRRVRDRVRQPIAGELRLQWWRDVLEGGARGDAEANPVAAALLDTVARKEISRGMLIDAIEAHRIALYGEAPATVADLETFFDRTIGARLRSEVQVLIGGSADAEEAVRHAAVALGIADLLRHLGHYVTRGFGVIPDEILQRREVGQGDVAARQNRENPAIRSVLTDLRILARRHLAALRGAKSRIPDGATPAFLTASLIEPLLRLSENPGTDPFAAELTVPQWRRQWILWRAAGRGGAG